MIFQKLKYTFFRGPLYILRNVSKKTSSLGRLDELIKKNYEKYFFPRYLSMLDIEFPEISPFQKKKIISTKKYLDLLCMYNFNNHKTDILFHIQKHKHLFHNQLSSLLAACTQRKHISR